MKTFSEIPQVDALPPIAEGEQIAVSNHGVTSLYTLKNGEFVLDVSSLDETFVEKDERVRRWERRKMSGNRKWKKNGGIR